MADILAASTKARKLSIQLQGTEFASDLSKRLLDHAVDMEKTYGQFQRLVKSEANSEAAYRPLMSLTEQKEKWFEEAEAGHVSRPLFFLKIFKAFYVLHVCDGFAGRQLRTEC